MVGGNERFGRDQGGLQGIERRRAGAEDVVGERDGLIWCASLQGQPCAQHPHGPLVPVAGLVSVRSVGVACASEEIACDIVPAADQMNLGERVEDRSGGLVKLNRTADFERTVQHLFGARQVAQPYADLSEGGQRDRQPMPRSMRLVNRHAPLGKRQRLLVAVLQHHHVGLVAAHRGQDVVGPHLRGEPFGLPEGHHGLFVPAHLRKRDTRQRMDERQMPSIPGGEERRGGLRDVLAARWRGRRPGGRTVPARSARGRCLWSRARFRRASATRPWRAIARDWSPRMEASRPWSHQSVARREAEIVSRNVSGVRPSAAAAWSRSS